MIQSVDSADYKTGVRIISWGRVIKAPSHPLVYINHMQSSADFKTGDDERSVFWTEYHTSSEVPCASDRLGNMIPFVDNETDSADYKTGVRIMGRVRKAPSQPLVYISHMQSSADSKTGV